MTNGTLQDPTAVGGEMRSVSGGSSTSGDGLTVLLTLDQDTVYFTGTIKRTSETSIKNLSYQKASEALEVSQAANRLLDVLGKYFGPKQPALPPCRIHIGLDLGNGERHSLSCGVAADAKSRVQVVRRFLEDLAKYLEP